MTTFTHISSGANLHTLAGRLDLAGRTLVEDMRQGASKAIQDHTPDVRQAPSNPRMMERHLLQTKERHTAFLHRLHMGPLANLNIGQAAPADTIRNFLIANHGKVAKGKRRPWPQAWYFLTRAQQRELENVRRSSLFGGPHPPPKMLEAINSGAILRTIPSTHSDLRYYMRAVGFVERIKSQVHADWQVRTAMVRL